MHVAVCRLTLRIHHSHSLKERRRIVQSLCDRLRRKYGVTVADVGGQDKWQTAEIGVCAVSGSATTVAELMDRAVQFAESTLVEAEITSREDDLFDY